MNSIAKVHMNITIRYLVHGQALTDNVYHENSIQGAYGGWEPMP